MPDYGLPSTFDPLYWSAPAQPFCPNGRETDRRGLIERPELGAQHLAGDLCLAPPFVGGRDVTVSDALDRLPRLVVEEEGVALLRDVSGALGVADEDEAGGAFSRHAQDYMGSRPKCFRLTV
jgi:hypothetical protein